MEILNDYLVPVVMATCFAIGYIIKRFIPEGSKYIPLVMGVLGIGLNVWLQGQGLTPQILLGGLASGLAATGAYELVKNLSTTEAE